MVKTVIILLIASCRLLSYVRSACEPNDEFDPNNETTKEWDDFMDKITELTFEPITKPCASGIGNAIMNASSDFYWDFRFKVYNERYDNDTNTQKTIENCYSESNSNDTLDNNCANFKTCMKEARKSMYNDTVKFWDETVPIELSRLAQLC